MSTLQQVIDRARYFLQDVKAPQRHLDAELEMYLEDAFAEMYRLRPDIFSSNGCKSVLPTWDALTEPFPLGGQWVRPAALFIAGSADIKEDQYAADGRALMLIGSARRAMAGEI